VHDVLCLKVGAVVAQREGSREGNVPLSDCTVVRARGNAGKKGIEVYCGSCDPGMPNCMLAELVVRPGNGDGGV
jgi:hypothetical protein